MALSFVLFGLLLSLLKPTAGVNCTFEELNPCRCVLSDGYRGMVDFSPIFRRGPLIYTVSQSTIASSTISVNPCLPRTHQHVASWIFGNPRRTLYYGNIGNETKVVQFDKFIVEDDNFEFTLIYWLYEGDYSLLLRFVYDASASGHLDIIAIGYIPGGPIGPDGMELKVVSQYVKPLFYSDSATAGRYPVVHGVCEGWEGERSLVYRTGLINMASPVVRLNSTASVPRADYRIGVCVNPGPLPAPESSSTGEDCYAVRRSFAFGGSVQEVCLGRAFRAQLVDQRELGWMLMRYPFGDFVAGCKDYASTDVLFVCDRQSHESSALYPENPFAEVCRYQFIWPTHLACPNVTSPSQSPAFSNPYYILLGLSSTIAVVLLVVMAGLLATSFYFWRRKFPQH